MNQVYKSFKGTAREFIAAGVTINGKAGLRVEYREEVKEFVSA